MSTKQKDVEAVQKVLGEPVICEFAPRVHQLRNLLFVVTLIGIGYELGGLTVQDGSSILGLKVAGLNDQFVRTTLLGIVLYLTLHFVWCAWDYLLEWRLRITGTRVAFITTARFASDEGDYPNDPRQSTLYNWWIENAHQISRIEEDMDRMGDDINNLRNSLLEVRDQQELADLNALRQPLNEIHETIRQVKQKVDNIDKIKRSERTAASLARFDNWFQIFLRSQNLRWLLVDFGLPLAGAAFAIGLLACGQNA